MLGIRGTASGSLTESQFTITGCQATVEHVQASYRGTRNLDARSSLKNLSISKSTSTARILNSSISKSTSTAGLSKLRCMHGGTPWRRMNEHEHSPAPPWLQLLQSRAVPAGPHDASNNRAGADSIQPPACSSSGQWIHRHETRPRTRHMRSPLPR